MIWTLCKIKNKTTDNGFTSNIAREKGYQWKNKISKIKPQMMIKNKKNRNFNINFEPKIFFQIINNNAK
jgi:hypothetical protein